MHSRDSYHCTIPAFGMETPPQQPGTRVGCGYAGCSPRPPAQGQSVLHAPCTSTEGKTSLLSSHWSAKKDTSHGTDSSQACCERSFWGGREELSLSKEKSAQNNCSELDKNPKPSSAKAKFGLPHMWSGKRQIHCCKETRKRERHNILAWQLFLLMWKINWKNF